MRLFRRTKKCDALVLRCAYLERCAYLVSWNERWNNRALTKKSDSGYQLGCTIAPESAHRPEKHVKNALQNITTDWIPHSVVSNTSYPFQTILRVQQPWLVCRSVPIVAWHPPLFFTFCLCPVLWLCSECPTVDLPLVNVDTRGGWCLDAVALSPSTSCGPLVTAIPWGRSRK